MRTRRTVLRVALLLPLAVGLLAVPGWAQEAEDPCAGDEGRTVEVMVGDAAYAPAEVTIEPCDTVLWTFITEEGQSVTADVQGDSRPFDSHPNCQVVNPPLLPPSRQDCSQQGETFPHRFRTEGSFAYGSRVDEELRGRVVVAVPPPPSPPPSPSPQSPSPSEEPSPSDSGSPDDAPPPSDDDTEDEDPADGDGSGDPEPSDDEPPPPTEDPTEPEGSPSPTRSPVPQTGSAPRFSQAPVDPGPDEVEGPLVAGSRPDPSPTPTASRTSDEPEFDDLPSAAELDTDEPDEVVIAAGDDGDGDGTRLVWGLLGSGLLAATLGTFGRIVLFGDAWG